MIKILVIRLSSIGDIVLTTPVIRCLKTQLPDTEIHYLTKKQYADILIANPYVDKVWEYSSNMRKLLWTLQLEQFDYIIDLHNNLRTFRIKNQLRVLSFSFNKLNIKKWLLVNFGINRLPDIHIVDRYMKTLELFDIHNDGKGLDFFTDMDIEKGLGLPMEFIGLVIGAQHGTKKATPALLASVCDQLRLPVVILGGPEDHELSLAIQNLVLDRNKIVDMTGKLSLMQSAAAVKLSKAVITHDTGLMHIAAAFKKPVISLWGNTIPEFGMYPYLPGDGSRIFEIKGLSCRPCSKIGHPSCPKKHFKCMKLQDPEAIATYTNSISK